jgi:hypothetical protein
MRLQILAARTALAALIAGLALAGAAIAGVRLGLLPYPGGITIMTAATLLGLLALALALTWLWQAARRNAGEAKRPGLIALAGALVFVYFPLTTAYYGLVMPPIHDASTDPDDPPQFVALAAARTAAMNRPAFDGQAHIRYRGEEMTISYALHNYKNGLITQPYSKLLPHSDKPVATLFWRAFEVAKRMGWHIVDYNQAQGRIEATTASFWFGRISDIAIRVRPSGIGARIDLRAESRRGTRDNGFNIRLIRDFRAALP